MTLITQKHKKITLMRKPSPGSVESPVMTIHSLGHRTSSSSNTALKELSDRYFTNSLKVIQILNRYSPKQYTTV